MSLVLAVYLACARTMTLERASAYRSCITNYVGNLKSVYPLSSLHPNHHAAFHIYDYLILFGPVQSWWMFPFKRLIGALQRLPSNHKPGECVFRLHGNQSWWFLIGELENAIFHSYVKGAKLHAWISRPDCLTAIHECKVLLNRAYQSQDASEKTNADGIILPNFTDHSNAVTLPNDLQQLTGQSTAVG